MENQNQNPLPMLPDPLEDQPVALPTPLTPAGSTTPAKPKRNYLRMGLIFGGVMVVLLITLFGSRLIDLLNLRGTKAGQTVSISGTEFISNPDWYEKDSQGNFHYDNESLFEIKDGKLTLTQLSAN